MKVGYPCLNRSIGCTTSRTFRLASYSREKFRSVFSENLVCLEKTLRYNKDKGFLFFRISSDLVPFASHPVLDVSWEKENKNKLKGLGTFIRRSDFRISMHPDQFIVLNSEKIDVVKRSVKELEYHAQLFSELGCGSDAKIQLHVGGVYGQKEKAKARFCRVYEKLAPLVKKHLVIENDERSYSLADCLDINRRTGIPVLFDSFHHECLNEGEPLKEALIRASGTWEEKDGLLMVDFSHQKKGFRRGSHAESLEKDVFTKFLDEALDIDCDIMLEIKDKEKSALKAFEVLRTERKEIRPGVFSKKK